jgi:ParB family chromosome partitioning protein
MDLEHQHLDLRYAELRRRNARRERQLLGSLSEHGQLVPVVVVPAEAAGRYVLVDGYKRVRALRTLARDTVQALVWELGAAEALLLERVMRSAEPDTAIEQGWLLCALRDEHGLGLEELARRFDRSLSWVSRRIGLVEGLPREVQERVRRGQVPPHAAMKYLLPLARANRADCLQLASGLSGPISTRQMASLYAAYQAADAAGRVRLCAQPLLCLRALAAAEQPVEDGEQPIDHVLLRDLGALAGISRRAQRLLGAGRARILEASQRSQLRQAADQARHDTSRLFELAARELGDAGP